MDEITEEPGAVIERVAALDIGKATLTACGSRMRASPERAARRSAPTPR